MHKGAHKQNSILRTSSGTQQYSMSRSQDVAGNLVILPSALLRKMKYFKDWMITDYYFNLPSMKYKWQIFLFKKNSSWDTVFLYPSVSGDRLHVNLCSKQGQLINTAEFIIPIHLKYWKTKIVLSQGHVLALRTLLPWSSNITSEKSWILKKNSYF